jgi:hypothetical protein
MKKWITLLLSLAPLTLFAETTFNLDYIENLKDPYTKGGNIIALVFSSNVGFHDETVDVTMILKNRAGKKSFRYFHRKYLEDPGSGDKTINVFDKPRDIKGTGVLTVSHGAYDDDVWIYLPVVKRVKRISSHNQSGPFVGSEFAYEDVSAWEMEKYKSKYLRDDVFEGRECFVLEDFPTYNNSGYIRRIEWVDKTIFRPVKIVYYDRKNALLKTLVYKNYRQYLGRYWRPDETIMTNHQTGKSTRALFKNYRFRTGLTRRDFTKTSLKRVR